MAKGAIVEVEGLSRLESTKELSVSGTLSVTGSLTVRQSVQLSGAISTNFRKINANETLGVNDSNIVGDTAGGVVTITLSDIALVPSGREVKIKKIGSGANNLIVDGNGAQTIDGEAQQTMTTVSSSLTLIADTNDNNWLIF